MGLTLDLLNVPVIDFSNPVHAYLESSLVVQGSQILSRVILDVFQDGRLVDIGLTSHQQLRANGGRVTSGESLILRTRTKPGVEPAIPWFIRRDLTTVQRRLHLFLQDEDSVDSVNENYIM